MMTCTYGFMGLVRLVKNWLLTRIFYSNARLVRFSIYIRGRSFLKLGDGLTTGVNVRVDAFAPHKKPLLSYWEACTDQRLYSYWCAIEQIIIGDHVLIASRVFISDLNHGNYQVQDDFSGSEIRPVDRPLSSRPVRIGNNVWLGEQFCILPESLLEMMR